jgi:hydroxypyruvate isomerase
MVSRRDALKSTVAALGFAALEGPVLSNAALRQTKPAGVPYKQAVARWCYQNIPLDDFARAIAEMGIKGVDLVGAEDWPTLKKHGLVCSITSGGGTIADGLNRKENHEKIEREFRDNIPRAAAAGVPNVITFSGNRRGLPDQEGMENCVIGLNRVKGLAEQYGVTICLELLNSKVDHKDYQCDRTAWGAAVVKGVGSPRVKLLYDIYHMQIMEGDIIATIRANKEWIGHYHTGGVPGRHEIDVSQELNYPAIMRAVAGTGFAGFVAHEFVPTGGDPLASLREAVKLCTV